jgi:hypothetical protein
MPTEGDRELIEEPDLAKDHLPRRRGPPAEEANLCLPFHSRRPWLRSEPERHVGGMDESLLTTDLQRSGPIRIGRDRDLPCHARGGENSLSTRVHESEEGRVMLRFRPGERDADHRPVHDAPRGMHGTARYVLDVREDPREGLRAGHALELPEAHEFGSTLLLGRRAEHAGVVDSLGPQPFEEGIGGLSGGDDLATLDRYPLPLEPAE